MIMNKFVIMTIPRTGSTMLCSALDHHPEINCGMEIFNPYVSPTQSCFQWRKEVFQRLYGMDQKDMKIETPCLRYKIDEKRHNLLPFLSEVFVAYNGFKLIYGHLDNDSYVLKEIAKRQDLCVVYLERDWLESCLSFKLAKNSGVWHRKSNSIVIKDEPFVFPFDEVKWYFDHICSADKGVRQMFSDKQNITISYRDLVSKWSKVTKEIQEMIGVSVMELPILFSKRTKIAPREAIINYDELKSRFAGTEYAGLFRNRPKMML